ncbi:unnamed protein product [Closterium sp. NIES-53]
MEPAASAAAASAPRRYLLTVEYIGSAFSGWQKQPLGNNPLPSVQGALEEAIGKLVGSVPAGNHKKQRGKGSKRPQSEAQERADAKADAADAGTGATADAADANRLGASGASGSEAAASCRGDTEALPPPLPLSLPQVVGSSRTDAGVHALGNTCHVDIHRVSRRYPGKQVPPFLPKELTRAINHFLQLSAAEASVVAAREVPLSFHARFRATERTYLYRIHASPSNHPSIFDRNRVWHVPAHLDVHAMRAAAATLCGFHDFSSFRASGCQAHSPLRSLSELSIFEVPSWSACLPPSSHPSCTTWHGPDGPKREAEGREVSTWHGPEGAKAGAEEGEGEVVEVVCGEKRGREEEGVSAEGRVEGASGKRLRGEERGEEVQGEEEDGVEKEEGGGGEKISERKRESEKEETRRVREGTREEGEGKEGEGGEGGEEGKEREEKGDRVESGEGVQMLVVRARAPSFLYHQVRLLVGLLKAVGAGAMQPDTVKSILDARDIRGVPPMAPACGLYLASVAYGPHRPKQGSSQE